jgi:hypothetical protein
VNLQLGRCWFLDAVLLLFFYRAIHLLLHLFGLFYRAAVQADAAAAVHLAAGSVFHSYAWFSPRLLCCNHVLEWLRIGCLLCRSVLALTLFLDPFCRAPGVRVHRVHDAAGRPLLRRVPQEQHVGRVPGAPDSLVF